LKSSKLERASDAGAAEQSPRSISVDAHSIDSSDLFVGTREVTIRHGSETYRLRLTAQNKLILTK
jgi:hemin uptake protein HemP